MIYILRRMRRLSISRWHPFDPFSAQPEELIFELLDENEHSAGQLACSRIAVTKDSRISTPWGEASVHSGLREVKISINGTPEAIMTSSSLKKWAELAFSSGQTIRFKVGGSSRGDLDYSDTTGSICLRREEGRLASPSARRSIRLTVDEIKRMPRKTRPLSIEGDDYIQYRLTIQGKLPVDEECLAKSLLPLVALGTLIDEGMPQQRYFVKKTEME